MNPKARPDESTDPTLGGILGDGTSKIRSLSCETTRINHSDPEGLSENEPSMTDHIDIRFDIELGPDEWLPARATLRQTHYQGAFTELKSLGCGTFDDLAEFDSNTEILYAMGMPRARLAGGWKSSLQLQQWMLSRIAGLCFEQGAELQSIDAAGASKRVELLGERMLALCEPSQCNYAPWGKALALALSAGELQTIGEAGHLAQLIQASLPQDALGLVYRHSDRLETWQIKGLIDRGMSTEWSHTIRRWSDYDDGSSSEDLCVETGGLMHEAVSLDSNFEIAAPWRLRALAGLCDPAERDSQGRTAWELAKENIAALSSVDGPYSTQISEGALEALLGADAFFESLALREALSRKVLASVEAPSIRL